jgi:putative tryptophan/tyrosine transport system substrate-binding protein
MVRLNKRRTLLGAIGAGLAAPRFAFAQAARIATVAVLFAGDSDDDEPTVRPFFEEMARLGWSEGKNVVYDRHSGKGTRQYLATMASLAAEREPDLIYATTTTLSAAVLKETDTVPVVFASAVDPVSAGLVASLARPGKNATGSWLVTEDASERRFALVREALPLARRVGAVFDRGSQEYQSRKAAHEKSARAAGLELVSVEFTNFEAIAKILAQFKRDGVTVVEVTPSFALLGRRREVVALAERNGIALVGHRVEWAEAGAVMIYGVDSGESHRRAAGLADRILKGAKPADLPVVRVQKFELALNTRAAEALGLHLPQSILKKAGKVFS